MNYFKKLTSAATLLALGACSSATTTAPVSVASVGTVAKDFKGGYVVTVNGATTNMGIRTSITPGGLIWNKSTLIAYGFENTDVRVAGGITRSPTTPFAGVTGTVAGTPATATYTGRIGLVGVHPTTGTLVDQNSILNLSVDTTALTVKQNSGGVTINGTIVGSAFTGTVDWSGFTAPMAGGFYGANTAAGAFSSAELAGAFLGTKQP